VKVKFNEGATAELEAALEWYGARSKIVERRLAREVENSLAKILASPARFLKVSVQHRACSLVDFPYQIIYRVVGDVMVVIAVAHTSRRPGYWKRRR
jgi:toxin ParE1/3/4